MRSYLDKAKVNHKRIVRYVEVDAVFNADYEFNIYFVKKLDFGIENRVLNFSKIVF
jgi:hypothetical protein